MIIPDTSSTHPSLSNRKAEEDKIEKSMSVRLERESGLFIIKSLSLF